jgi:nucleoside-diphosphate kinase
VERTLIIIKPDAVQRGLIGEIVARFERRGLRIVGMKLIQMDRDLAARHYAVHKDKSFYGPLLDYITSAPVVVMALEGTDAVKAARNTIGATNPAEAGAGSIRGDFGLEVGRNLVHGSDSVENGEKEVALFFGDGGLVAWGRDVDRWVFEKR